MFSFCINTKRTTVRQEGLIAGNSNLSGAIHPIFFYNSQMFRKDKGKELPLSGQASLQIFLFWPAIITAFSRAQNVLTNMAFSGSSFGQKELFKNTTKDEEILSKPGH